MFDTMLRDYVELSIEDGETRADQFDAVFDRASTVVDMYFDAAWDLEGTPVEVQGTGKIVNLDFRTAARSIRLGVDPEFKINWDQLRQVLSALIQQTGTC